MNEVKLLNIGGIDQNVKDQYARDIIAPSENGLDSTSNLPVASRPYKTGEYLIGQDRLYYEAIADIEIGDTLIVNVNIKATTVSDELVSLRSKSADAAIECIAPMEKTGLSSAEYKVGEYLYWDYGLNAGLYKVKAAIHINDAFVVDTNIEAAEPITKPLAMLEGLKEEFTQVNNEFGVKNLLPNNAVSKEVNGVTFTVNSDGTFVASGTHTQSTAQSFTIYSKSTSNLVVGKTYRLSNGLTSSLTACNLVLQLFNSSDTKLLEVNCPSGVVDFTVPSGTTKMSVALWFKSTTFGTSTFKPMIRPAYITDDTYEPYARSNSELAGEVESMLNVLGSKNLLPNQAVTSVLNGMTFTVNPNGTITLNGTTSALTVFDICRNLSFDINRQYIVSGFGERSSGNSYIQIQWSDGNYSIKGDEEWIFTPKTEKATLVQLVLAAGQSFSNYVVKPMIRPSYIKDNTYAPYAMTNRQISDFLIDMNKPEKHIWNVVGNICNSADGQMNGSGVATVVKLSEHIVKIDYEYTITATTSSTSYNWGLNRNLLRIIDPSIPLITPLHGGVCNLYSHNDTSAGWDVMPDGFNGYGGSNTANGEFWQFARNYNGTSLGGFAANIIPYNIRLVGTCYGTI